MESEYVRAKTAVAVAYADARHQPEPSGAVIPVEDLADLLQEQLRDDDPWLLNLFEPATKDDYDQFVGFVTALKDQATESEETDETDEEPAPESPADVMKAQRRRKQRVEKEATSDPKTTGEPASE